VTIFEKLRSRRTQPQGPSVQEMEAEIVKLSAENRQRRDPEVERQILKLRHRTGIGLVQGANGGGSITTAAGELPSANGAGLPEFSPGDLTPELVRAAILRDGCVLVRGLVDRDEATRLTAEIDKVFEARERVGAEGSDPAGYYEAFQPEPPYGIMERSFVSDAGDAFAGDSPRLIFDALEGFDRAGLRELIVGYLGERPALSVNKCVLRRVQPSAGSAWHQDGAFLGNVKALNVWLSLSRCGDESPGLDIVPRRIDEIVETGTEGELFNWSVSRAVAEREAGTAGVIRPIFEPGDALLFDDRFLHATATDPAMTKTRYAIESWFFAPSAFPDGYVPIAF
jgi:hypothetical protein